MAIFISAVDCVASASPVPVSQVLRNGPHLNITWRHEYQLLLASVLRAALKKVMMLSLECHVYPKVKCLGHVAVTSQRLVV